MILQDKKLGKVEVSTIGLPEGGGGEKANGIRFDGERPYLDWIED